MSLGHSRAVRRPYRGLATARTVGEADGEAVAEGNRVGAATDWSGAGAESGAHAPGVSAPVTMTLARAYLRVTPSPPRSVSAPARPRWIQREVANACSSRTGCRACLHVAAREREGPEIRPGPADPVEGNEPEPNV